jgi:hypothetical protein
MLARAEDADERLHPRIGEERVGHAEVEGFLPQRREGEPRLLGAEAHADPGFGPAGADGGRDGGVTGDEATYWIPFSAEKSIEAITRGLLGISFFIPSAPFPPKARGRRGFDC